MMTDDPGFIQTNCDQLVDEIDDTKWLTELIRRPELELPKPGPRKRKRK